MSRNELYVYRARPITAERRAAIVELAESLLDEARFDIENTRSTYEALIDLLGVASLGVCAEHAELTRDADVTVPIE